MFKDFGKYQFIIRMQINLHINYQIYNTISHSRLKHFKQFPEFDPNVSC